MRLWQGRVPRPPEGPRALQPVAVKGSAPGTHLQSDVEIEICPSFDFAVRSSKHTYELMPHAGMLIECLRGWKHYRTIETKLELMQLFELVYRCVLVLEKKRKTFVFFEFFRQFIER